MLGLKLNHVSERGPSTENPGPSGDDRWILSQAVSNAEIWFFYVASLNNLLSKLTSCRLFDTPWFVLDNWQLRCCPSLRLEVVSSIPAGSTIIYRFLVGLYAFPCTRESKFNQQICISPTPGRSSILTHTGVEIDTCAFQTGCQLPSATSGMSLSLCFWAQFQWH